MQSVTAAKGTAMRRYGRLQKIGTLLRYLEALAALLLLFWFSARLPTAAKISGEFLRYLTSILLGPRFLFLLGNAIVLLLFVDSRHLSSPSSSSSSSAAGEIYDGISSFLPPPPARAEEVVVYEDKAVCVETRHTCRRSLSERMERRKKTPELRRSKTEKHPKAEEDAEEFRRTIEAFIEKQLRFQREESMAIVSADGPSTLLSSAGPPELTKI